MASNERPAAMHTPTRNVVRWNDDLDKSILLFINFACSEAGIKIPFARVAELMGPRFSPGAIVQHIAKIRNKMQEEKEKSNPGLLVPPPNKRGSVTKPPSAMGYGTPAQHRTSGMTPLVFGCDIDSEQAAVKRELEEDVGDDDFDYEWPASGKRSKNMSGAATQRRPERLGYSGSRPATDEYDEDAEDTYSPRCSTPVRTRQGINVHRPSIVGGASGNEGSGSQNAFHWEYNLLGQLSGQQPSISAHQLSSSLGAMAGNPGFQATVMPQYATPDMSNAGISFPGMATTNLASLNVANAGSTSSTAAGIVNPGRTLVHPPAREIDPFVDFDAWNFKPRNPAARAGMQSGTATPESGSTSHRSLSSGGSQSSATSVPQTPNNYSIKLSPPPSVAQTAGNHFIVMPQLPSASLAQTASNHLTFLAQPPQPSLHHAATNQSISLPRQPAPPVPQTASNSSIAPPPPPPAPPATTGASVVLTVDPASPNELLSANDNAQETPCSLWDGNYQCHSDDQDLADMFQYLQDPSDVEEAEAEPLSKLPDTSGRVGTTQDFD